MMCSANSHDTAGSSTEQWVIASDTVNHEESRAHDHSVMATLGLDYIWN